MKSPTIALLLTVSVCVGQEFYQPVFHKRIAFLDTSGNIMHATPKTFEDLYNSRLEDFATIFVILWDEYAKECWVDSVEVVVYQYRKMFKSEIEDSMKYGSSRWESYYGNDRNRFHLVIPMKSKRWIHPTEPTLEGFVEFLRRKTK